MTDHAESDQVSHQGTLIVCPPCDRVIEHDSDGAIGIAQRHDQQRHDGENVVRLYGDGVVETDEVNELMDETRSECNGQQYREFVDTVIHDPRFKVGEVDD